MTTFDTTLTLEIHLRYFGDKALYLAILEAPDSGFSQEESKKLKPMLYSDDSETVELAKELINIKCI
jgi:O-phosphoseryl-tRNA(Cys) synthetase